MWAATIDAGTTNTRVQAWHRTAGQAWMPVARSQQPIGVRDTAIQGSNLALRNAVVQALQQVAVLADHDAQQHGWARLDGPEQFDLVLASGMITSNLGLYELPHVWAPADRERLAQAMILVRIDGIDVPIWMTPGVKNNVAADCGHWSSVSGQPEQLHSLAHPPQPGAMPALLALDVMRGEEVEALALLEHLQTSAPTMLVLPGSHTKLIVADGQRRLLRCRTTLAGEMLAALTQHTVLRAALDGRMAASCLPQWLEHGAALCHQDGLARAAFHVRSLRSAPGWLADRAQALLGPDLIGALDVEAGANTLLGAVIADDLRTLAADMDVLRQALDVATIPVVIAGAGLLAQAWQHLARQRFGDCVTWVPTGDAAVTPALHALSGAGALLLAQTRGLWAVDA